MKKNKRTPEDDLFDKIQKYYHESGKLSDKEREICMRYERAFALLCENKIRSVAIQKYIATFDPPISLPLAYKDFKAAEDIFAPMQKYTKDFLRMVIIESAMRDIAECERKLNPEDGSEINVKDFGIIQAVKDKAEKRIISASGLKDEDVEKFDFAKLQAHIYQINVPKEVEKGFGKMLKKGVVDASELYAEMAEDAHFEDIDSIAEAEDNE
jgi:hypothetical protein